MRCEYPVLIRARKSYGRREHEAPVEKFVPCGQCYTCRRKVVRTRQGQAVLEQRFPLNDAYASPRGMHFFTLTYEDTPMTEPRAHRLGWAHDGEEERPWNGPFVEARSRIEKVDGVPYWLRDGRPKRELTQSEIAYEHHRYLTEKLKWSRDMVSQWISGDYEPVSTVRYADIQKFLKRLRKGFAQRYPDRPTFRYLASTEYGGITDRPHAHLMLWGFPHDGIEEVYSAWRGYGNGLGHVHPDYVDAVITGSSELRDKAATYQAKDLVKSRHLFNASPTVFDREPPRVEGSRRPPIGDGAYNWWLDTHVLPAAFRGIAADLPPGQSRLTYTVRCIRTAYTVVHVYFDNGPCYPPESMSFPTTATWRRRVQAQSGIPDEVWEAATDENEFLEVTYADYVRTDEGGLGQAHGDAITQLRDHAAEVQQRESLRTSRKREALLSAGRLRPGQ